MEQQQSTQQPSLSSQQQDLQDKQIFVGDLDDQLDQQQIVKLFSQYGNVKNAEFKKVPTINGINAYCFITYQDQQDATNAIQKANGILFGQKVIRVSKFKNPRDSDKEANVYIKVDKELTINQIKDYCSNFGNVVSIKLPSNESGQLHGYGYVQFEKAEFAKKLIEQQAHIIEDKQIYVQKYVDKKEIEETKEKKIIYVSDMSSEGNQNEDEKQQILQSTAEQHGEVTEIVFKKDTKGRYYSFITFSNQEQAEKAIESLNKKDIFNDGKQVSVSWAKSKEEREQKTDTSLWLRNICEKVTEQQLIEAFEQFGKVTSVSMFTKNKPYNNQQNKKASNPTQNGQVNFALPEDCEKAQAMGYENPKVKALFENKTPFITIYQDIMQRQEFSKTINTDQKKQLLPYHDLQQQQLYQNSFQNQMMMMGPMMYPQYKRYPQQHQFGYQQPRQNYKHYNNNNNNQYQHKRNYNNQYRDNNNYKQRNYQQQQTPQERQQNQQIDLEKLAEQLEARIALGDEDKKQVWNHLGSMVYPQVKRIIQDEKKSQKITGMLVDLQNYKVKEILQTIQNTETLENQVKEANELLDSQANQQ